MQAHRASRIASRVAVRFAFPLPLRNPMARGQQLGVDAALSTAKSEPASSAATAPAPASSGAAAFPPPQARCSPHRVPARRRALGSHARQLRAAAAGVRLEGEGWRCGTATGPAHGLRLGCLECARGSATRGCLAAPRSQQLCCPVVRPAPRGSGSRPPLVPTFPATFVMTDELADGVTRRVLAGALVAAARRRPARPR